MIDKLACLVSATFGFPNVMISIPIPQEIISLILEQYLLDDTSTLQTCALVAHSFLISSQKGLFHTIIFNNATKERCQNLHQALLHNPNLLAYVRELFVFDYDKWFLRLYILYPDPTDTLGL